MTGQYAFSFFCMPPQETHTNTQVNGCFYGDLCEHYHVLYNVHHVVPIAWSPTHIKITKYPNP